MGHLLFESVIFLPAPNVCEDKDNFSFLPGLQDSISEFLGVNASLVVSSIIAFAFSFSFSLSDGYVYVMLVGYETCDGGK